MSPKEFQKIVYEYYKTHGRHSLPWRKTNDPYKILVSEIMLQQTQVDRVVPKFQSFIKKFPTVRVLAKASLHDVLLLWQGLGYNRRALYLKRAAESIAKEHKGIFPKTVEALEALPGIGHYTARAVCTFAYNQPNVFIETNIRTVYIHHFFPKKKKVADIELLPLIEKTLDTKNSRLWYAALMDYGSMLKKTIQNPSRRSRSHIKQSKFKGSLREARGKILRYITEQERVLARTLPRIFKDLEREKVTQALQSLIHEEMIIQKGKFVLSQK